MLRPETERALRALANETIAPELEAAIRTQLSEPPSEHAARIENACLALFACAELTRDESERERWSAVAKRGMEYAVHCDPDSGGLYEGLAGLLASHRVGKDLFEVSLPERIRCSLLESVVADIEEREAERSGADPATLEETYDLLHGWGGILAMAQREDGQIAELLRATCEKLLRANVRESNGYAYFRAHGPLDIEQYGEAVNLGTAHGVVGLLGPLLRSHALGPIADGVLRLLVDLDTRASGRDPTMHSIFPSSLPIAALGDLRNWLHSRGTQTRFGWCYGDAGVALVLSRAHEVRSFTKLGKTVERLVARCAEGHRSKLPSLVVDASLCHGASGNFHALAELYRMTKDEALRPGLEFWAEDLLSWSKNRRVLFLPEQNGYEVLKPMSLLGGWAGVALPIASALGAIPGTWDHVLGLS